MKTIYNIQLARAIAALFVVYAHIGLPGATFGHFGVDIFFIISGFIMTFVCVKSPDAFFMRRLVRIVPLYWIITLSIFILTYYRPSLLNSTTLNFGNLFRSLFFWPYIKENGTLHPMLDVGWTLNYEMYFYALISVALVFTNPRYATRLASVAMSLIYLILKFFLYFIPSIPFFFRPLALFYSSHYIFEFVFGVAAYYLTQNGKIQKISQGVNLAVLFLCLVILIYIQGMFPLESSFTLLTLGLPSLLFVTSMVLLEQKNVVFTKFTLLGDASYAVYLTHQFVVEGFRKVLIKYIHLPMYSFVSCFLIILLSVFLGIFIFVFIEKPIHNKLKALL